MTPVFSFCHLLAMRFLLLLITAVIVAGIVNTTGAVYDSRNYANHRAHVFINGDQIVSVTPVGNALAPDNTIGGIGIQLDANGEAVIKVTSPANPVLAASAQIHVEIETGVVEQQPTFVEANEWIAVLNAGKYQASLDLLGGFIGGGAQGGSGIVGTIAGGFLLVGDIGAIGINVGRQFGWAEGDYDSLETSMAVVGILLTGTPADAIPTFCRAILVTLKTLPAHLAEKAVRLLRTTYKLLLKNIEAVPTLWSLIQRIYNDPDLVKAVFVASDGSFEALKAVSEGFAMYGDDLLHFLKRLPLNSADEIANAGKCVKCLNDAGPAFKNAVLASGRALATVMDEISAVIKGGTHAAEKIDPATLVSLLQKLASRPNQIGYKVTHFTNHLATLLSKNLNIQGLFSKAQGSSNPCLVDNIFNQLNAPNFGVLGGNLLHLQEAAKLAQGGQTIAFLEKSGGQFMDIVLQNGSRYYEVKLSFQTLVGSKAAQNVPDAAGAISSIIREAQQQGLDPNKLTIVLGQGWNGNFPLIPPAVITLVHKQFPGVQFLNVPFKDASIPYLVP